VNCGWITLSNTDQAAFAEADCRGVAPSSTNFRAARAAEIASRMTTPVDDLRFFPY